MKESNTEQSKQIVHQTLHGYSKGHRLLASSIDFEEDDADLILSLSDLTGSLAGRNSFDPYDTFYPLPSRKFFAVARTFPDDDAPRPGCVLTHTLLIPMKTWKTERNISQFECHFQMFPSRNDLARFRSGLRLEHSSQRARDFALEISEGWLQAFVSRFFEKEINPLVITDFSQSSSSLFWRLASISWPNLRSEISCCTWALEPRFMSAKKPFDLMFVPHSAISKFEFGSSHFLDSAARIDSEFSEDWTIEITKMLCANEVPKQNNELFNELPKERSSIRKFLVFQNLSIKSLTTPRAALGALDILSSLSSSPSHCTDLKQELGESVLRLVEQSQYAQENLETLQILSQKLISKPLSRTIHSLGPRIRALVKRFTLSDAEYAVSLLSSNLGSKKRQQVSPFTLGVVDGLLEIDVDQLLELFERLQFIMFGNPEIIREQPRLVELYIMLGDKLHRWNARNELANIIPRLDVTTQMIVFDYLLPYAVASDIQLLRALVSSGFEKDVTTVLDKLEAKSFFLDVVLVRSVAPLAMPYRAEVRKWLKSKSLWNEGLLALSARTWDSSVEGLGELLANERPEYREHILLEYLLGVVQVSDVREWMRGSTSITSELFSALLVIDFQISSEMVNLLSELFQSVELRVDNVVRKALLKKELPQILQVSGVKEALLRGTIAECIHSSVSEKESMQELMQSSYISQCLHQVASWKLREWLFFEATEAGTSVKVLEWLAICPSNFLQDRNSEVLHLVDFAVRRASVGDCQDLARAWIHLLTSIEKALTEYQYLRFCGHALKFSFENVRRPLSKVCVSTFYPVYKSVVRKGFPTPPEVDHLFSFYTWDRGKELRKRLVTSYSESNWPAGDLAISIPDRELRRKIIRRLQGTRNGSQYINKMISDLKKRQCDEELIKELSALGRSSATDEDWL